MRWRNRVGVASTTRRAAALAGAVGAPTSTNLGELRRFVASLDKWPNYAYVSSTSGAVLRVEFTEDVDPLLTP